ATASPPPPYNFAVMPEVTEIDAFWEMKRTGRVATETEYRPIEMPRNSATGFVSAVFAVATGFALIWHIWWLAIIGVIGAVATIMVFGWIEHREFEISAAEVARIEQARPGLGRAA